jgi:VanZ family protein
VEIQMLESLTTNLTRRKRLATIARWGTLLLLLAMFMGTHLPLADHEIISLASPADKILHVLGYMILAISVLASWELTIGLLQPPHYFTVWLLGMLYSAFDEVSQIPVGRTCDALDWFSDILGIVLGLIFFRFASPLLYRFVSKTTWHF